MHPFIENFLARPKSHKIGFWVASIIAISFAFWQYFYSPALGQATKLENEIFDLEKKITDERRRAANLSKMREMVAELDAKLKAVLKELPDNTNITQLIDSISELARGAGLEITLFTRNEDAMKDFYAEVPVSISVEGSYHQVASFFDEVSHLDRIVNISNITLKEPKITEEQVRVKVGCTATTFRYLSEAERAKVAESSKAEGAKRKR